MDRNRDYPCCCGDELMAVYFDDNEATVEFAIYQHNPYNLSLMERLRECVRIFRGRSRFHDQIILSRDQAKTLGMDLLGGIRSPGGDKS